MNPRLLSFIPGIVPHIPWLHLRSFLDRFRSDLSPSMVLSFVKAHAKGTTLLCYIIGTPQKHFAFDSDWKGFDSGWQNPSPNRLALPPKESLVHLHHLPKGGRPSVSWSYAATSTTYPPRYFQFHVLDNWYDSLWGFLVHRIDRKTHVCHEVFDFLPLVESITPPTIYIGQVQFAKRPLSHRSRVRDWSG